MRKINKLNISLLALVMTLFLITLVSAFPATPVAANITIGINSTISGVTNLNCTLPHDYNDTFVAYGQNWTNATFWIRSLGSTGNTTWVRWRAVDPAGGVIANTTEGGVFFTTNETTIFEDGSDYEVICEIYNGTLRLNSSTTTGIIIDNTIPQSAVATTPTDKSFDTDGSLTFNVTVTASNSTNCTLYFPNQNPGVSNYIMTHTGGTCYLAFTSIPEQTYDWYVLVSDGLNTTSTYNMSTVNIRYPESGGNTPPPEGEITPEEKKKNIITGVIVGLVILGIIVFLFKRKR